MRFSKKGDIIDIIWCVVLLVASILLCTIALFNIVNTNSKLYEYNELEYKEYTIQHAKQIIPEGGGQYSRRYYKITVEEEAKPLYLDSLSVDGINEDRINNIKSGENVSCYVVKAKEDKYSYKLIEFKISNDILLSLDSYNKLHKNSNIMLNITLIGAAIAFICFSINILKRNRKTIASN